MSRTVTAIFRTEDVARAVERQITQLGTSAAHVTVAGGSGREGEIDHLNLPHDEAVTYRQAVREGHWVVSADVDENKVQAVADVMRHPEGGVDIDAYETDYRASDNYDADLAAYGAAYGAPGAAAGTGTAATETAGHGETVELAEERLAVAKRDVGGGTTHVRTYVQEVPVEERIRLREERAHIETRDTGDRVVSGAEADALFQERDIAVNETSEEAVVSKEAVVTGEVVVDKEVTEREEVVSDTLRKTEVDVDKSKKNDAA
ncbi:MAG: YsnF/AvaK domain-containing protein [Paracoccaceae bacterium]